jgi:hypothetical protein
LRLTLLTAEHTDPKIQAELDEAFEALLAGETEKAAEILASYP